MHASTKIVWRDSERPKETKETLETVETSEDTYKYKIVWRDREKPKETKETVEAIGDTCKHKNCTDRDQRKLKRLQRVWRYVQIQNCMERQRPKETKDTRVTVETNGNT